MTETTKLVLLIALAVAALGLGVTQLIMALLRWEKRELRRRLDRQWAEEVAPAYGSLLARQAGGTGLLGRSELLRNLAARIKGAYPDVTLARFLGLVIIIAVLAGGGVYGVTRSPLAAAMAGAFGALVPFLKIGSRRAKRQRLLADQLVDALEFLSRVLRAGHGLSSGIQMIGDELPEPIATEFRRCHDQHSLGMPLEDAMTEMAGRVESGDFSFFVTSVLIQRQTGGDMAEILDNISGMIRARIRLERHVKAITAEGRLTAYILTALPAVLFAVIYVLNPQYAGTLLRTQAGQIMIVGGVIFQLLGLMFIKRIVTVKV